MLKIGITGGIGSGKSTVAKVFETLGIAVYYADDAARRIMNEDAGLIQQLIEHFGPGTYIDGQLNRKHLSSIVFNDKPKLELLNSLVHPATMRDSERWMAAQKGPYAIKEAALLFESGSGSDLDYIIGVYCPDTLRIHRTMKRDNVTREEVLARMKRQIKQVIKMRLCDFVVNNDEQHAVIPQVLELHERLKALSSL